MAENSSATRFSGARRSRSIRSITSALLLIAALAKAQAVVAAPTALERSLAEQLFIDGKRLMSEGRYDEACPKLAESHRLDPGGGTILNLAVCHEAQGRYASAWSEFREALDLARTDKRQDREEFAVKELARIEPKLSRLTIVVERPSETPGMVVTIDGETVHRAAWGAPFPIDAGVHEIVATAPGRKDRRATIRIEGPGDNKAVSISVLEPTSALPAPPVTAAPAMATIRSASEPLPSATSLETTSSGGRTAGFIVGSAGILALGTGAALGVVALGKNDESEKYCDGDVCTQAGVDLNDDAQRLANYSNVGVGVGVVALVVGTYLVLSATPTRAERAALRRRVPPQRLAVVPAVLPNGSSVGVSGTW